MLLWVRDALPKTGTFELAQVVPKSRLNGLGHSRHHGQSPATKTWTPWCHLGLLGYLIPKGMGFPIG